MIVVPRTLTPIAFNDIPGIVRSAIKKELGHEPDSHTVNNLSALIALEVARGKAVNNHNLGNISVSESFSGTAWRPPWFEVDSNSSERNKFLHEEMLAGRAPRAFRAYSTLADGAGDWARRMATTFKSALEAAAGPTEAFRVALSKGYSHEYSNPAAGKTLAALVTEFGGDPGGIAPSGGSRGRGIVFAIAGVGLGWYTLRYVRKRGTNKAVKS